MQMMMRAVATGLFLATLSVAQAQDGMLTVTDGRTTVEALGQWRPEAI
ncbi:MAG TPA: hypothetical protein VGA77_00970 [Propylenella sp.]